MSVSTKKTGITLIEVMLGVAILAILAMLAVTGLFYPTGLVVTSSREQSAINALSSGAERYLHNITAPIAEGIFNTFGTDVSATVTTNPPPDQTIPGTIGDTAEFSQIEVTVQYSNNRPPIRLITYRSREISGTNR